MFVDKAQIKIKAGNGGNGCCSFRREKFVPKGGPDGGDGGDGGDIIFKAAPGEQSLVNFVFNRHFKAENGEHGKGKNMHGRDGKDLVIKIPAGTIIRYLDTTVKTAIDIDTFDAEVIAAKGGKGGKGNTHFLSNKDKAPRKFEKGEEGEEFEIELELKVIADAGLVGFPNAGKSTLLNAISNAHPKVAPYPFTTLHPVVGTIEFDDFYRMTVADIPGLIENAHNNVGLGHDFLKHIERTKILIYVLDTGATEGRSPLDDFKTLQQELELYMKGLSKKPSIIAANKTDIKESEENLSILRKEITGIPIIPVSAKHDTDFSVLLNQIRNLLESNLVN